jgi:hypothetical protein
MTFWRSSSGSPRPASPPKPAKISDRHRGAGGRRACDRAQTGEINRISRSAAGALSEDELASLRREAEAELTDPGRWGTTFTLIQSWGRIEG